MHVSLHLFCVYSTLQGNNDIGKVPWTNIILLNTRNGRTQRYILSEIYCSGRYFHHDNATSRKMYIAAQR